MDSSLEKMIEEVKDKWTKVLRDDKTVSIEKKMQKIINIPLKDVKNIITVENKK